MVKKKEIESEKRKMMNVANKHAKRINKINNHCCY